MSSEPTAADIEEFARRDKIAFQRLAIDVLRVRAAGTAIVRGYDLGPGRKDFGFDAEIEGTFERLTGRIRVSAKGHLGWSDLRRDAADDARRHSELPLLLICALSVDVHQIEQLEADALAAGVPAVDVVHGSTLAEWLRDAPHLVQLYLRGRDCALVPVEQAIVRFAPHVAGRTEDGPWLSSEVAAVDAVLARKRAGAKAILLTYAPDTRPERCLWRSARDLAFAPSSEAITWVRTEGGAPLPADAWISPAFAGHPHTFVAPWGPLTVELVRWWCELPTVLSGSHRLVLAVPRGREDEVLYELEVQGRDVGRPGQVELGLPADAEELDELVRWLLPNLHSRVRREAFCDVYGMRPALLELGARGTHLLAARGQRAFPDAADLRALALIALIGAWPTRANVQEWMLAWLGSDSAILDTLAHRGQQEGWLEVRGDVYLPSSRANRWALVHAWKTRDAMAWRRLIYGLRSVPMEAMALLLPGLVEVEQYEEVEGFLLGDLEAATWHQWGSQLATLAVSGERVHEKILSLAEQALRGGAAPVALSTISDVVLVTPRFPRNLIRALRVCTLLLRAGLDSPYGNRKPAGLVKELSDPHRLAATAARRALEWVPEGVRRGELDIEVVEAFVSPWLHASVGVEESSGRSFSFGTSGWNPSNPELPGCWKAAAAVVLNLLTSPEPTSQGAGWRLMKSAGEEVALGPRPKDLRAPEPLVAVVIELALASLAHLPPETDWQLRQQAERALLSITERPFIPVDVAVEVLSRFSRDPLFRAWELCIDRHTAFPDPDAYTRTRIARGVAAAREERMGSYGFEDERADPVALQLMQLGHGTEDLFRLLDAVGASCRSSEGGWRGFEMFRAWAKLAPKVFEDVVTGPTWSRVPRELWSGLLWAVAPVLGARLLGQPEGSEPLMPEGAAAAVLRFLNSPCEVAPDDARAFIPAVELATSPADAAATLRVLCAHPDTWVRLDLSTWLYRLLLRGHASYADVRDIASQLCRCPGGMPAVDALLMLTRQKAHPKADLLLDDLVRAFQEHVSSENDEAAWRFVIANEFGLRPVIWRTFIQAPDLWWRFALTRLGDRLGFSEDRDFLRELPREVEPRHIAVALYTSPFPLDETYSRRARVIDALVGRLPYGTFTPLIESLLASRRDADARVLVISMGAEPALASVIGEVGARIDDDEALEQWARRVAYGGRGVRGFEPDLADDSADGPATSERAAAFRAKARELRGRGGRVLDFIADAL